MPRIFLDTSPLIYLAEGDETRRTAVREQLTRWIESDATLGSSTLTLMELLVAPKKQQDPRLERQYRTLLTTFLSEPLHPLAVEVADKAAEIRATLGFKTPDAIQLSTAAHFGYDIVYTNDHRFERFPDLDVVLVDGAEAP